MHYIYYTIHHLRGILAWGVPVCYSYSPVRYSYSPVCLGVLGVPTHATPTDKLPYPTIQLQPKNGNSPTHASTRRQPHLSLYAPPHQCTRQQPHLCTQYAPRTRTHAHKLNTGLAQTSTNKCKTVPITLTYYQHLTTIPTSH